jgi:uncharacterized protein (TIGR03083 family)
METSALLDHLRREFSLLRAALVTADSEAAVPSCPEWTAADLARHVTEVYMHKTECIRQGVFPDPWPPELPAGDPLPALDAAYADLLAEFDGHAPTDFAATPDPSDRTVGFWIRRMAQETAMHRADAELAAGTPAAVTPIPADLAVDGISELLDLFLEFACRTWPEEFAEPLAEADGRSVAVVAGEVTWFVALAKDGITVTRDGGEAAATIAGEAGEVLLALSHRLKDGEGAVRVTGDPVLLERFRAVRVLATQ